jgi:hypothetical protein
MYTPVRSALLTKSGNFQGEMMMNRCCAILAMLMVFAACSVQAQNAVPSASMSIKQSYNGIKMNLTKAADKMPEDGYGFQPTKEERNFGAWVAHVADTQMGLCSGVAGAKKSINAGSKTSKADLVAALKESFDTCDAVYDGLTEANAGDAVPSFRGQAARIAVLANNVAHDNECYGSMAVYLRLKGIVPPSSEPRP